MSLLQFVINIKHSKANEDIGTHILHTNYPSQRIELAPCKYKGVYFYFGVQKKLITY